MFIGLTRTKNLSRTEVYIIKSRVANENKQQHSAAWSGQHENVTSLSKAKYTRSVMSLCVIWVIMSATKLWAGQQCIVLNG